MNHTKKAFSDAVTIVVLLGGHAARLLPFLTSLYGHLVSTLVIDSPEELKRLGCATKASNVQTFALGINQSAQTLCDEAPVELQEHLKSVGGMDASLGMGQAIAVGYHAGKRLVKSPEFNAFIRKTLLPAIRTATGGSVETIRVVGMGGLAGGTYSGAEEPTADGFTEELLALTSATIMTHSLSTGEGWRCGTSRATHHLHFYARRSQSCQPSSSAGARGRWQV